ncbi:GNAT family N-acetyltransferase [Cohnella sp. CFH 77786]|uniref:GNAT family N-acetyltransferase n=1 Tax=Cohnella sp. CFH 77786 TaxID=2662265 RepID=UPI001C60AC7D|nr:GNAT family N-acetyltransferase [Cohnella sp. CFH 77786]MBW5444457.1 GNAT family N-acetyltransferase [Cohnella sp. CFH 77786]
MELVYRSLAPDDLEAICSFPQSAEELFYVSPKASYPLTPEQIWQTASERFHPTVVCDAESGKVAAYANLYDWNEEEKSCWLGNVIVAPSWRGRGGAAEFLLQAMMEQARVKLGADRLKLYCHNPNTRALLFYIRIGFAPNGGYKTVEHPSLRKIVVIEMEKSLLERMDADHE